MKAKLILWLLQMLTSERGRSALVAALILLLVPVVIVCSVIPITVPLVSDEQMEMYRAVAEAMPEEVVIDWRHMVAIDAVRNHQDFGEVTLETILETSEAFTKCEMVTHLKQKPINFEANAPGQYYTYTFTLDTEAEVWWEVEHLQGSASTMLVNSEGDEVSSGVLDPGTYQLWIVSTVAPTKTKVDLYQLTEVEVCSGKTPEVVMDEMGFSADDRQLAYVFMNTLADVA